jgi:hypothetical protein
LIYSKHKSNHPPLGNGNVTHFKINTPARIKLLLIIAGLAGLALAILYFSLPGITQSIVVAQADKFGLINLQFRAFHAGWRRLDLAGVTVGDAAAPSLRIDNVSIEYSLAGLWRKKIKNVRLAGARITIADRGRGFQFAGMVTPPAAPAQNGGMPTVERISLEDAVVRLAWAGRSLDVPVNATLRASGAGYDFSALLRPLAETVRLQGTIDKNFTAAAIAFTIPGLPLPTLIDQSGFGSAARWKGRIAVQGEIILKDGSFKKAAVSASGLGDVQLAVPDGASVILDSLSLAFTLGTGFTVRDVVAGARGRQLQIGEIAVKEPFDLAIRGRQWPDLEISVRGLQAARPLPVSVGHINGKLNGPWSVARISGDFAIQAGPGVMAALGLPGEINRPYALEGDFQGRRLAGAIAWALQAKGQGRLAVAMGQDSLRGRLDLNVSLQGDGQRLHASAACRMPAADLQLAGFSARAEIFSGNAELDHVFGGVFRGRGQASVRGGSIAAAAASGLQASGIRLEMPWHWPGQGRGAAGKFSVARLQSNGTRWQDIGGSLVQQDAGLRFSGYLHTPLPWIVLAFQGRTAPEQAGKKLQADFTLPQTVLPPNTSLQPLHPLLQGMSGGGRFQAEGKLWAGMDHAGGSAVLNIANAEFSLPKEGIALRGVNAKIQLDRLFDLVTAPSQRIEFRDLHWQDMLFSNGELVFSGDSDGSLAIASGRFDWCQGKITLAPLRIKPGAGDFLMTFTFDRVNFAQMLNALVGKTIVSGDAEMNGIVPIRMVKGSPVFLDGHLFSTPGIGGNLKVSQPELIANGQALVEEAIRDFRYNWIKVNMGSRNDRLDMVVSIDGAPARKLPLRYDARQKDFVRDPKGGRHVELKGLLLDIRFLDIDLKDLLKASSQMTSGYQEK